MSPILPLAVALIASLSSADEPATDARAPFLLAIEAVAAERYAEMARHLVAARAAAPSERARAALDEDCLTLAGLSPAVARELSRLIRGRAHVDADVDRPVRGLLVRTLAAEARRLATTFAHEDARQAADAAVRFASRFDDAGLIGAARLARAAVLLDLGPRSSDVSCIEADLTEARARAREEAADPLPIDFLDARRAHAVGDDAGAFSIVAPIELAGLDVREAFGVARLRAVVAARIGRHDAAASDARWLTRHLRSTDDATTRSRAAFALGTVERLRPPEPGESSEAVHRAAEEFYDRAAREATSKLDRAMALEWRGSVRSHLGRHRAAEKDFERAEALYTAAGRPTLAGRPRMRAAWNAFHAHDPVASRDWLTRFRDGLGQATHHPTGLLGERRNASHLGALIALAQDDLATAEDEIDALFRFDRDLTAPLGRKDILLTHPRRGEIQGSLVADLLACSRRQPRQRLRAFELATACVEHGRALLLAKLIAGPDRPTFGLRAGSLPPLPDGVAELRWATTAAEGGAPVRTVLLGRFRDRIVFETIDATDHLDASIEAFLGRWMRPESLDDPAATYAAEAHALFLRLFGAAAPWFTDSAPPRRVVVIADGAIERLPLDALVLSDPTDPADRVDQRTFADLHWFVDRCATVHVPSLGVLAALDAPNHHDAAVAVIDPIVRDGEGRSLPSLRSTALEREALAADRDVEILRREGATLPCLLEALERRDIGWLHLGGHAVADEEFHDRASLLLTTNSQTPSHLGVRRVVTLPLTPGVRVVLSACATASGVALPGEGVQALWRAFLVARASCVLSTLRAVDDRSAGHWMREFHTFAGQGAPLAEAAQRASRRWLSGASRPAFPRGHAVRDPCHPYLWAAWICVGHDGGALPLPRK